MQKPPSRFILPGGSLSFRQSAVSPASVLPNSWITCSAIHLLRQLPAVNQQWVPEPLLSDFLLQRKQQLIRCSAQTQAKLFEDTNRRRDFPANNAAKILGAKVTVFRGKITAEALFPANATKGSRQIF